MHSRATIDNTAATTKVAAGGQLGQAGSMHIMCPAAGSTLEAAGVSPGSPLSRRGTAAGYSRAPKPLLRDSVSKGLLPLSSFPTTFRFSSVGIAEEPAAAAAARGGSERRERAAFCVRYLRCRKRLQHAYCLQEKRAALSSPNAANTRPHSWAGAARLPRPSVCVPGHSIDGGAGAEVVLSERSCNWLMLLLRALRGGARSQAPPSTPASLPECVCMRGLVH